MKEAALYKQLEEQKVQCFVCPRECLIPLGKRGWCKTRVNEGGKLKTMIYGLCSSVATDPIEKKPLFHFYPGSLVLSFGTLGCNLRCKHCQNWQIAHEEPALNGSSLSVVSPEKAVEMALASSCRGIAWTYNEPTIWFEYTLDTAKLCKKHGLYTVYVTNGYISLEALDVIGPYLDSFRVDIKGFTPGLYRRLAGVADFKPILRAAERAKVKWKMHLEVVTNVIPTWNDDENQLREIARWIKNSLGEDTPWHVSRFYPYLELSHLPPTPTSTLEKARQIGFDEGLNFVYLGNVPGHEGENTHCPNCKRLVIERAGYTLGCFEVVAGKCKYCQRDLNLRGDWS